MAALLRWTCGKLAMPFAIYSSISSMFLAMAAEEKAVAAESRAIVAERQRDEAEEKVEESQERLAELMRQLREEEEKEMAESGDENGTRRRFFLIIGPECAICLTNQRETLFEPCRHIVACRSCAQRMEERGNQECPICRHKIDKTSRIYQ